MSLQSKLETISKNYQKTQNELFKIIEARQKLSSQLQENKLVQKEFSILENDAIIYKLTGPVLVKQEKSEAILNVKKRLEYIETEIKRLEIQIKKHNQSLEEQKLDIFKLQTQIQENPT
ncbi:hypothetical protein PORY_002611 [Pneumocystis oryctolagi]|uniref:Uncharacterized protein n=1 Tax=Pneumocystis oryctolagi TaxID=42067 RepID=A0ACB7C8W1_9ASCO|nr:hypothetical protein PORY_002611 [Pneumocystis oryctolagi]